MDSSYSFQISNFKFLLCFLSSKLMESITEEILHLVKQKMTAQGAFNRDAYKQYIEETIDDFIAQGKLTDDDNLEFMEDKLIDMWEAVNEALAK